MKGRANSAIGEILVQMGAVTSEQLDDMVELQERSSIEVMLGKLLVAHRFITEEQLEVALNAQEGLRSKKVAKQAMAQMRIIQQSGESAVGVAQDFKARARELIRKTTGSGHPAVTSKMLAIEDER